MMNRKKKKMAIVSSIDFVQWPMGGVLSFLRDLLPFLGDYFEIDLWGVRAVAGDEEGEIEIGDRKFKRFFFSDIYKFMESPVPKMFIIEKDLYRYRDRILDGGYDYIYFHCVPCEIPFLIKKRRKNVKILSHIHGITNPFAVAGDWKNNPLLIKGYEIMRDFVIKRSDKVFIASDSQAFRYFSRRFRNYPIFNNMYQIHNFADPGVFYPRDRKALRKKLGWEEGVNYIIYSSRLSYHKDPCLALDTIDALAGKIQNIRLIVAGDGPLFQECKNRVENSALKDYVRLLGRVERVVLAELLSASDLYLYTSRSNGVPLSVVEAMLSGLPVVTPDITGIHDLVLQEYSGFVAKERSGTALAEGVEYVLERKEYMGENALKIASNYTPENVARKLAQYIVGS